MLTDLAAEDLQKQLEVLLVTGGRPSAAASLVPEGAGSCALLQGHSDASAVVPRLRPGLDMLVLVLRNQCERRVEGGAVTIATTQV